MHGASQEETGLLASACPAPTSQVTLLQEKEKKEKENLW